jgi:hypothetical protein
MRKFLLLMLCCMLGAYSLQAQSKVFKEVGEGISSQIRSIVQDNTLVGYLVFTELEKVSEDSFNYKISIMDENLNDIGTVNFRQQKLFLGGVSFDQDVLCLAYFKSNIVGNEFTNNKAYKNAVPNANNSIFTQFLSLDGKIIKTNSIPVEIKMSSTTYYNNKLTGEGTLKHGIELSNVPEKGFACIFGDENSNRLVIYNAAGNQVWKKTIEDAAGFSLLTSKEDIYILSKKKDDDMPEAGWELSGYGFKDSAVYDRYILKDKQGNSLKVLGFGNDPATGKPYLSGNIINSKRAKHFGIAKDNWHGAYSGVFTLNVNGHKKSDFNEVCSYWNDGSQSGVVSIKGKFVDTKQYGRFYQSIKDYQGNTYFIGTGLIKKVKYPAIACAVIFSPIIVPTFMILAVGTTKARASDAILLKQNEKGALSLDNSVPSNASPYWPAHLPIAESKTLYSITNSDTKTNYLVVDDPKNITVYNITQKKIARTIPHKDGKIQVNVYPAKEGSILVSEYNKKEKYTRYSIESL